MSHEFQVGDMAWSTKCRMLVQVAGPLKCWNRHLVGDKVVTEPTYAYRIMTLQARHVSELLIAEPRDLRPLERQFLGSWNKIAEKLEGWKPAGLRA